MYAHSFVRSIASKMWVCLLVVCALGAGCSGAAGMQPDILAIEPPDKDTFDPLAMVLLSSGTFTMGSPADEPGRDAAYEAQHTAEITENFYIARYPVTQGLYQAVLNYAPSYFAKGSVSAEDEAEAETRRPVESVSWYEAIMFCNTLSIREGLTPVYRINGSTDPGEWSALLSAGASMDAASLLTAAAILDAAVVINGANGYRLPTEAEWEYACRAGTATAYHTGAEIGDTTGWYLDNSEGMTHAAGTKPANAWGVYDTHGNVAEWCWDRDGSGFAVKRALRGGAWNSDGQGIRSAARTHALPYFQSSGTGFRVARTAYPDGYVVNAAAPVISMQPADASYTAGDIPQELSVTASVSDGGTLTYQWYKNTSASTNGGQAIAGETGAGYVPDTGSEARAYYYVIITNTNDAVTGAETASVTSGLACVTVVCHAEVPVITAQPRDAHYSVGNTPQALSVTASVSDGGTLTYQWYRNTAESTNGAAAITGAAGTGRTYTPSAAAEGRFYYYVVITNTNGAVSGIQTAAVTSAIVLIAVDSNAATPAISVQPVSSANPYMTYVGGTPVTLSVTASVSDGGRLTYQWYRNTANSTSGGTAIAGATGTTYAVPVTANGDTYYYVIITNTNNNVLGAKTATRTSTIAKITARVWTKMKPALFADAGQRLSAIAYRNGRWMVGGYRYVGGTIVPMIAYSDDGINWTASVAATVVFGNSGVHAIAYCNDRWIAAGNVTIAYSTDNGVGWTKVANSSFRSGDGFIQSIAYGGGRYVVGGWQFEIVGNSRLMIPKIAYSANGTTWTQVDLRTLIGNPAYSNEGDINALASNGTRIVAVGNYGRLAYSDNGSAWTKVANNPLEGRTYLSSMARANNHYVVAGSKSAGYSQDGLTWTASANPPSFGCTAICFGYDRFVTASLDCGIAYSTNNGANWTTAVPEVEYIEGNNSGRLFEDGEPESIAYGNDRFIAVGETGVMAYCLWP